MRKNKLVDPDLAMLIASKAIHNKKFKPETLKQFVDLVREANAELQFTKGFRSYLLDYPILCCDTEQLVERADVIMGELDGGNDSTHARMELTVILDRLYREGTLSKAQLDNYRKMYDLPSTRKSGGGKFTYNIRDFEKAERRRKKLAAETD